MLLFLWSINKIKNIKQKATETMNVRTAFEMLHIINKMVFTIIINLFYYLAT